MQRNGTEGNGRGGVVGVRCKQFLSLFLFIYPLFICICEAPTTRGCLLQANTQLNQSKSRCLLPSEAADSAPPTISYFPFRCLSLVRGGVAVFGFDWLLYLQATLLYLLPSTNKTDTARGGEQSWMGMRRGRRRRS